MKNHQLSDAQLQEIMTRYYNGENNQQLIDEFNLTVHTNNLFRLFPNIVLNDCLCPYCHAPLVAPPYSKASRYIDYSRAHCETCGHVNTKSCMCDGCTDAKVSEKLEKSNKLEECLADILSPKRAEDVRIDSMSLRSAVNLIGLCRAGLMENSDQIKAAANLSDIVAYDVKTKDSIYSDLSENCLIGVSVQGSLESLDFLAAYENKTRHDYISFELTLGKSRDDNLTILSAIEKTLKNRVLWPPHWHEELLSVWLELALEEVLHYLTIKLREHQLEPEIGKKTISVFTDLLQNFSISQIYNFIWGSVTNAVAYQVRKGLNRRHTSNLIPISCQQRAEKAMCEGWIVKEYRRDTSVPASTRVSLFSNVVTDLGDDFFTSVPNKKLFATDELS